MKLINGVHYRSLPVPESLSFGVYLSKLLSSPVELELVLSNGSEDQRVIRVKDTNIPVATYFTGDGKLTHFQLLTDIVACKGVECRFCSQEKDYQIRLILARVFKQDSSGMSNDEYNPFFSYINIAGIKKCIDLRDLEELTATLDGSKGEIDRVIKADFTYFLKFLLPLDTKSLQYSLCHSRRQLEEAIKLAKGRHIRLSSGDVALVDFMCPLITNDESAKTRTTKDIMAEVTKATMDIVKTENVDGLFDALQYGVDIGSNDALQAVITQMQERLTKSAESAKSQAPTVDIAEGKKYTIGELISLGYIKPLVLEPFGCTPKFAKHTLRVEYLDKIKLY